MANAGKSIEVNVPIRQAYDQWTQFESFPRFMEGIAEVRQIDDTRTHWRASMMGIDVEWDAEITEQIPDEIVAWRSTSGAENSGSVRFAPMGPEKTRVTVEINYQPDGQSSGGSDQMREGEQHGEDDLDRFKRFIEGQANATGGWRGEIHDGMVTGAARDGEAAMGD